MPCYVYVIELNDNVGPRRDARFPNVYVGETCRSREERFRQHKSGYFAGDRKWAPFVVRLRPDLSEDLPDSIFGRTQNWPRSHSPRNSRAGDTPFAASEGRCASGTADRRRVPASSVCGELPAEPLGYHRWAMTLVHNPHPERFTSGRLLAGERAEFAQLFRQRGDTHAFQGKRRDCADLRH